MSNTLVGVLTAIPYGFAAVFMVWWARRSDRKQERRWHVALPLFTAATGLLLMIFVQDNIVLSLLLLTIITVAVYATYGPFWSLPSLFMTGAAAAVGMASINSIANLGGFVGPFGFGALEDATGSIYLGLSIVAIVLIISGALVVKLAFVKNAEALARRVVIEEDPTLVGVVAGTTTSHRPALTCTNPLPSPSTKDNTMTTTTERTDTTTLTRLAELGAATVYEANGQIGALDAGLKPLDPTSTLAGRAVTLDLAPADNWYVHLALLECGPGDVLVIDAKGFLEAGPWGDVLTAAAQERGVAGLVIDGAVRDSQDIIASGFPVFARGLSIKGTTKVVPGKINVPVTVGGVVVEPGDVIIGDADGLVRVPADQVHSALASSEARAAKEERFVQQIRGNGATTLDLLGLPRPA